MELRIANRHVPERLFPSGEVRIWLGRPETAKARKQLERVRASLREVARAGDWDTIAEVAARKLSAGEVHAAVQRRGITSYREDVIDRSTIPTLAEAFDEFLPQIENPDTRAVYRSASRALVGILGAGTPMTQIAETDVDEAMAGVRTRWSAGYRSKLLTVGSALYTWWLRKERAEARKAGRRPVMTAHPFRRAKSVPTPTTRHRFLSREEYRTLLEVVDPPLVAQYAACVWAGLRAGEFIHLRPEDVSEDVIRIQPQPTWTPKGWPKSRRSVRDIPVHRTELAPLLEEHRQLYAGDERFFVNPRTGLPWNYRVWIDQVRRDVEAAGLVYGAAHDRGITTHTFRHTLGSWMAQKDKQILKIARILGNTVEVAARHYTHLLPEDLDQTIQDL